MSSTYPAGTLTVRGTTIEIFTDDDGQWLAYPGGGKVTAGSRDGLKAALGRHLRSAAAKVAVPFYGMTSPRPGQGPARPRKGTATGIHSGSHNVLVTWEDGEKSQIGSYGSEKYLSGDIDPAEWARLADAYLEASRAVYAFEQAHKLDLRAEVRAAIAAQLTQGETAGEAS